MNRLILALTLGSIFAGAAHAAPDADGEVAVKEELTQAQSQGKVEGPADQAASSERAGKADRQSKHGERRDGKGTPPRGGVRSVPPFMRSTAIHVSRLPLLH